MKCSPWAGAKTLLITYFVLDSGDKWAQPGNLTWGGSHTVAVGGWIELS